MEKTLEEALSECKIDELGRIYLPIWLRKEMELLPGDDLQVKIKGLSAVCTLEELGFVCLPIEIRKKIGERKTYHIDVKNKICILSKENGTNNKCKGRFLWKKRK